MALKIVTFKKPDDSVLSKSKILPQKANVNLI